MSTKNLKDRIGKTVAVRLEEGKLTVACKVVDARVNYGRTDYLVTPVAGSGETWVGDARVTFPRPS
jgi:hypothetical protein